MLRGALASMSPATNMPKEAGERNEQAHDEQRAVPGRADCPPPLSERGNLGTVGEAACESTAFDTIPCITSYSRKPAEKDSKEERDKAHGEHRPYPDGRREGA